MLRLDPLPWFPISAIGRGVRGFGLLGKPGNLALRSEMAPWKWSARIGIAAHALAATPVLRADGARAGSRLPISSRRWGRSVHEIARVTIMTVTVMLPTVWW